MPEVTSGRVLVTGANGYVAAWVLKDLLDSGYTVRGTVRAQSKATYLRERFAAFGGKLEIVIVDDITKDGAFDDATVGVDAIAHIASPMNLNVTDPEEMIGPAVRGTTSILQSAVKNRASVKRVICVSTTAALFSPAVGSGPVTERIIDERDWNEISVPHVREKGRDADKMHMYRASKVLAEQAAWDFWKSEDEKARLAGESGLGWDLVVLCPPWVLGPITHEVASKDNFGGSQGVWYKNVVQGASVGDALTKSGFEWVDVRDLARAHVRAMQVPGAGGERFIVRGGRAVWQDFVNTARKFCDKISAGDTSYDPGNVVHPSRYVADKSIKILGIHHRSMEELTKDSLDDFAARGWL